MEGVDWRATRLPLLLLLLLFGVTPNDCGVRPREGGGRAHHPAIRALTTIAGIHNFESFRLGDTGLHVIVIGRSVVNKNNKKNDNNNNYSHTFIPAIGTSVIGNIAPNDKDNINGTVSGNEQANDQDSTGSSVMDNEQPNKDNTGTTDMRNKHSNNQDNVGTNTMRNKPTTEDEIMSTGVMGSEPPNTDKGYIQPGIEPTNTCNDGNTHEGNAPSSEPEAKPSSDSTGEGNTQSEIQPTNENEKGRIIQSGFMLTDDSNNGATKTTNGENEGKGDSELLQTSNTASMARSEMEIISDSIVEGVKNTDKESLITSNKESNVNGENFSDTEINSDKQSTQSNDRPSSKIPSDKESQTVNGNESNYTQDTESVTKGNSSNNHDRNWETTNSEHNTINIKESKVVREQGKETTANTETKTPSDRDTKPVSVAQPPSETKTAGQEIRRMVLAKIMKDQFDQFKERLARTADSTGPQQKLKNIVSATPTSLSPETSGRGRSFSSSQAEESGRSSLQVGETVIKSERRAGEDPSGIKSGILRVDHHPIPVTFTSLPGFPSFPPRSPASPGVTVGGGGASPQGGAPTTGGGSLAPFGVNTRFTSQTPAGTGTSFPRVPGLVGGRPSLLLGTSTAARRTQVGDLMRLLQTRLIGGLKEATTTTGPATQPPPGRSQLQQFDPSIVVNFLTLVALSQNRGAGSSSSGQRNAAPVSIPSLPSLQPSARTTGEFGPFSSGNDPAAGVDPSTIVLPPMLRQTLYSYLLPRLASLTALVETIPGVPGLDYPIIAQVPYTNFYCSNMPWPGFYADTEARCQVWHYCDLDGRQASFLCPNGTMFNQAFFVCDWWYNMDCQSAPYLYFLNERIFDVPEVDETAPHRTLTAEVLDTIFL